MSFPFVTDRNNSCPFDVKTLALTAIVIQTRQSYDALVMLHKVAFAKRAIVSRLTNDSYRKRKKHEKKMSRFPNEISGSRIDFSYAT